MTHIPWLDIASDGFPATEHALDYPNGLLAAGGDLTPARLIRAYSLGIFPWFEQGQPILWWSPSPRMVLYPDELHCSRSLRKTLRKGIYRVTADTAFEQVMQKCAAPRDYTDQTWITDDMLSAYTELHCLGYAHSVETWYEGELVGGLYGVQLGNVFFGESMFSTMTDASKVAFVGAVDYLKHKGCKLIDCQVESSHLLSLGACNISREKFTEHLRSWITSTAPGQAWRP